MTAIHVRPRMSRSSAPRVGQRAGAAPRGAGHERAAARSSPRRRAARASPGRRRGGRDGGGPRRPWGRATGVRRAARLRGGGAAHAVRPSSLRAARRRADASAGCAATSPASGRSTRRVSSSACGLARRTRTREVGRADAPARAVGQEALHAPVFERCGRRSLQTGRRCARSAQASGSARSSCPSSSLTAMRIAWNERLAGWPPAKRARAGIAAVITSTSSLVVSIGSRDAARGRSRVRSGAA